MREELIDLLVAPAKALLPSVKRERVAAKRADDGCVRASPACGADDGISRDVNCFDPSDAGCGEGGDGGFGEALDADLFIVLGAQVRGLDGVDGGGWVADKEAFSLLGY